MTAGIYNTHPMESPRYQLAKARKTFQGLKPAFASYVNSGPFALVSEDAPSTGMKRLVLRRIKNPPIEVADAVNDAFEALRKALDQTGFAVSKASGGRGKKCSFPFGDSEKEVRGRRTGQSQELPEEIFEMMVGFRPYKDGDQLLWTLNEIANTSKHRLTKTYPGSLSGASLSNLSFSGSGSILGPWREDLGEMLIAEYTAGSSLSVGDLSFGVHLVFGSIPIVESNPIDPVFEYLEVKVTQILDEIEAKSIQLGIFQS